MHSLIGVSVRCTRATLVNAAMLTSFALMVPQVMAHGNDPAHAGSSLEQLIKQSASGPDGQEEIFSESLMPLIEPANAQAVVSEVLRQAAPQTMSSVLGGAWSPVYDWPIVAIHQALLPNGKVLSWDATPDDSDEDPLTIDNSTTRVTLWDPVANTHLATNNDTGTDLFCAGSAHLWDGRILFAGGDAGVAGANAPLEHSNIYTPETNTWQRAADMNAPRWYSSVAALANGEMLTIGGAYEGELVNEVFQFDQTWRALSNAEPTSGDGWWLQIEEGSDSIAFDYQWIQAAPDGSVITFGPQNIVANIDTRGTGSWTDKATRDNVPLRDYGSYAMFDIGKILVSGGGPSVDTAVIVDANTQQTSDTGSMNIGRRQHNLTILADGSVLVTGGNTDGARYYSPEAGTKVPELWNPLTGQFTLMNPMQGDRQYHSSALLLPDGRVLSGGGGICGDCYRLGYEERNAEIFSPPYLFSSDGTLASRPGLSDVPEMANYGQTIQVTTTIGSPIQRAHLLKLGSATHSENQDQRLVPVEFTQTGTQVSLALPASRNLAPPGHYLLFLVDDAGVPSEGGMIKVGQPLVTPGERVVSTLEPGRMDTYAYSLPAGRWTSELSADLPVSLYLSASAPGNSAELAAASCSSEVDGSSNQSCQIDIASAGTWYVTVTGSQRSDYRLDARMDVSTGGTTGSTDEPGPSPGPSPGPENNSANRVTTGGAFSIYLAGLLLFFIRKRWTGPEKSPCERKSLMSKGNCYTASTNSGRLALRMYRV